MVLLLVAGGGAGVGLGVVAGGLTAGPLRQWTERFGQHDTAQGSDFVRFEGAGGEAARDRGSPHGHGYDDEQGYPLEGSGEDFAYAAPPGAPAFQQAPPPDQMMILQGPDGRYRPMGWADRDDPGDDRDDNADAPPAFRQRQFTPAPQALPLSRSPAARLPASPPLDDAAAAAAARARAAADEVTAAEHATS